MENLEGEFLRYVENLEGGFLRHYFEVYGSTRHRSEEATRRLRDNEGLVKVVLDEGLALSIVEPTIGASRFNLGMIFRDLGNSDAALVAFADAMALLDPSDPDRVAAAEDALALSITSGYEHVNEALQRFLKNAG